MVNYKDLGLVNTREMFARAVKGGYAIPAFNFNNMEQLQAIIKAAEADNCVFVGRCADYILRDAPRIISFFVTANLEERIQRVMQRQQCDEKKAAAIIHEGDERRAAYYDFYTGKTWGHGFSYDLCINSSILGIRGTADFLGQFVETKFSKQCGE